MTLDEKVRANTSDDTSTLTSLVSQMSVVNGNLDQVMVINPGFADRLDKVDGVY